MNVPVLKGYYRFPSLSGNRTLSYFIAVPAYTPLVAVIEIFGTNPIVSASALFKGQNIPVIVQSGIITANIQTVHSDINQSHEIVWTLNFAQAPQSIRYFHRLLVDPAIASPSALQFGAPNVIPCDLITGCSRVDFFTPNANTITPLLFVDTGLGVQYENFGFNTPKIVDIIGNQLGNNYALLDWCSDKFAGYLNIEPYEIPEIPSPTWAEAMRFCVQSVPRTSANAVVIELDTNINSSSFSNTRVTIVEDVALCPLGSTAPDWQDDSEPFCQPEPRTSCGKLIEQRDLNPLSATFNTTRTVPFPASSTDCDDCPPTSTFPNFQDTGEWRCIYPPIGRQDAEAEKRQVDTNPYSPLFNTEQWVSLGQRVDLCPLDTNACNWAVWIDAKDGDCNLITRCKQDAPRTVSTRQKLQLQVNPNFPPDPNGDPAPNQRWVDLPPSPEDADLCPVGTCNPIYIPVCPQEIRCKFESPRLSSMTEILVVDVNPNSATVGESVWIDHEDDAILCPIDQEASQFSLSSATLFACQQPEDFVPSCVSFFFQPGANIGIFNNFGLFNIGPVPQQIRQRWNLARTVVESPFAGGQINTPNWMDCGITNGTQEFRTSTRFDDVIRWAKVYHNARAGRESSTPTPDADMITISVWKGNDIDISNVTTRFRVFNSSEVMILDYSVADEQIIAASGVNYGLIYTPNCPNTAQNNIPHQNRQVNPFQNLPQGDTINYRYWSFVFRSVGLYKFVHEVFINNTLYARQQGYIRNLL